MFDSTTLTFRAKGATIKRLEELQSATGLSRGRLLAQLIERAQVQPVIGYQVEPVHLARTQNGGAMELDPQRAAISDPFANSKRAEAVEGGGAFAS